MIADLVDRARVALDLDGVVYHGAEAVPGAVRAVARLRASGFRVGFATNGSARTQAEVASKLAALGIPCGPEDVVTSAHVAARRTRSLVGEGSVVAVVGTAALVTELALAGVGVTDDPDRAAAVLVGHAPDLSYEALTVALRALHRGVPLVACNRDRSFPGAGGLLFPGCAAGVAAVEAAAGRVADEVVGKPSPLMLEDLMARTGTRPTDWFVVGDSREADMAMAAAAGVPGVLVGVSGAEGRPGQRNSHLDLASFVDDLLDTSPHYSPVRPESDKESR